MAVGAVDALFVRQFVRELDAAAQIVFLFRDLMAAGAGGQTLVEELVFEVAKKTRRGGHRHVLALHDLAVATRAAQLLAATESQQVRRVVEVNALIFHAARKQAGLMAAGAEATGVGYFRRRPGPFAAGDVLGQLHQPQQLAAKLVGEPRRKVALDAGHVLMARFLPRLVVRLHDVAGIAELRARRVPARRAGHEQQQQH